VYEIGQRLRYLDHGVIRDFPQFDSLFGARITSLAWLDENYWWRHPQAAA